MLSFHDSSLPFSMFSFLLTIGFQRVSCLVRLEEAQHILQNCHHRFNGNSSSRHWAISVISGEIPVISWLVFWSVSGLVWFGPFDTGIGHSDIPAEGNCDTLKFWRNDYVIHLPGRLFSALPKKNPKKTSSFIKGWETVLWCANPVVVLGWSTLEEKRCSLK